LIALYIFAGIGITVTMLCIVIGVWMWLLQGDEALTYDTEGRQIDYAWRTG